MKQYVVDAFTDTVFHGNPAAVCVLPTWPSEELMQSIAIENSLSETAFLVKEEERYGLRWFTPGGEIDLCGHATLASAFVILTYYEPSLTEVSFSTRSGILTVTKQEKLYTMEFPAYDLTSVPVTPEMTDALGVRPLEAYLGRDLLLILSSEEEVCGLRPDPEKVKDLPGLLCHVTAKGEGDYDCISRSFCPKLAIPEDPVCGSGHCHIIPYWSKVLEQTSLTAYQASQRSGVLYCESDEKNHRVYLSGKAVLFAEADLKIPLQYD